MLVCLFFNIQLNSMFLFWNSVFYIKVSSFKFQNLILIKMDLIQVSPDKDLLFRGVIVIIFLDNVYSLLILTFFHNEYFNKHNRNLSL